MVENTPNGPLIGEEFSFSLAFVSPVAYWTSDEISLGLGIPREVSAFSMTFEIPCPTVATVAEAEESKDLPQLPQ